MANKRTRRKIAQSFERERVLKLLTNEFSDLKKNTLTVIYDGADFDELGYMDGKDPDTGEIVPLLVGLAPKEDDTFDIYPIARLYLGRDIPAFEVPDGQGNYINRDAAKEESGASEGLNQE